MTTAVLLSGSNLGDRKTNLEKAQQMLEDFCGKIILSSKIYETESWGFTAPAFYNQATVIETNLEPQKLLIQTQHIEKLLGRENNTKSASYTSRTIDIDILFYGNRIINTENLQIPHPLIASRRFVLVPLSEIMPDFIHPVSKKTIWELLQACADNGVVSEV